MNQSHFYTIEDIRKYDKDLSLEERGMIQSLHQQGFSLRSIVAEVGCAHMAVFYELRRGTPVRKSNRGRAI